MRYIDQPTLARAFRSWRQEHGYRISEAARVTLYSSSTEKLPAICSGDQCFS